MLKVILHKLSPFKSGRLIKGKLAVTYRHFLFLFPSRLYSTQLHDHGW